MNHKDTKNTKEEKGKANRLSREIIGAAIEVHRELGPGLLESLYEEAMAVELMLRGIPYHRQLKVPVTFKGRSLGAPLKLDLLVDELVVVELKSVERLLPIHDAQVLTYLRITEKWLGLIFNFNTIPLNQGIRRLVAGI